VQADELLATGTRRHSPTIRHDETCTVSIVDIDNFFIYSRNLQILNVNFSQWELL